MKRWPGILLWILAAIVVIVIVLLSYLPTFLEDYIHDNDLELIGREVEVENIDINYFTGKVAIENFKMYEEDASTVFTSFSRLELDLEIGHLFSNGIYIQDFIIDGFFARVKQNETAFNFDDLMESEKTAPEPKADESEPMHFTLANFKLRGASLEYSSEIHPEVVFDSLNVELPLFSDTVSVFDILASLHVGSGGHLAIGNRIDLENSFYDVFL